MADILNNANKYFYFTGLSFYFSAGYFCCSKNALPKLS
ncbi:hypothetical protein EDD70_1354 [Hydrogenoanaerobacterium saccharovorans]|uniref:Uncharacterized protein n=1 Tax=Hydrogenoanaerobacterium saccharovorans TaxID=474960 RepID=A0A1H7ZKX6_9FIRM|nr:hypothetical protein EDD70_1354 [Hydrogenoanaerobacterium saccharovorans]SEM58913.1 hypothetical protein SAMN05216180_0736 [Hydrogenoanaerobacterium saccharovorans]